RGRRRAKWRGREAPLRQPHGALLGLRAETLELGLRPGARRFRLGAQLPQIHLADISADRIGSGAKLGERGAALDLLPLLDEHGLNEAGGSGGGANETLIWNEPAGDGGLAGIGGSGD